MKAHIQEACRKVHESFLKNSHFDPATLLDIHDPGPLETVLRNETRSFSQQDQKRIFNEFLGWGPIEEVLSFEDITEILINRRDEIWCERSGCLSKIEDTFLSELTYSNFVRRLTREMNVALTLDHPYASGKWRQFRVQLVSPPLTEDFVISFRRHPGNPWTLDRFEEKGFCSSRQKKILRELLAQRNNILIVGPTGSGKTSLLSALLRELPGNERVILIEDTQELCVPNPASVHLLTRIDAQQILTSIDLSNLVRHSLRLRPDRLIVGEVRGGEAKELLMALSTGHSGSLGTLHASTANEALLRLEMLIQMGASQWSLNSIRRLIQLSLSHIVVVEKSSEGDRKLKGIYRISSLEEFGFLVEEIDTL